MPRVSADLGTVAAVLARLARISTSAARRLIIPGAVSIEGPDAQPRRKLLDPDETLGHDVIGWTLRWGKSGRAILVDVLAQREADEQQRRERERDVCAYWASRNPLHDGISWAQRAAMLRVVRSERHGRAVGR